MFMFYINIWKIQTPMNAIMYAQWLLCFLEYFNRGTILLPTLWWLVNIRFYGIYYYIHCSFYAMKIWAIASYWIDNTVEPLYAAIQQLIYIWIGYIESAINKNEKPACAISLKHGRLEIYQVEETSFFKTCSWGLKEEYLVS